MANKMTPEELQHFEEAQKGFALAKRGLQMVIKSLSRLMEIQESQGRLRALSRIFAVKTAAMLAEAYVFRAHSEGTDTAVDCWEEPPITTQGGGGR